MKKSKLIREYIYIYKPTRKQLETFCKYCLNFKDNISLQDRAKWCHNVSQKMTKKQLNIEGYYSTNIQTWLNNGIVLKKDKRYYLTTRAIKKGWTLYSYPLEVKVKQLQASNENWRWNYRRLKSLQLDEHRELSKAKEILKELGLFCGRFHSLTTHFDKIVTKYDIEI